MFALPIARTSFLHSTAVRLALCPRAQLSFSLLKNILTFSVFNNRLITDVVWSNPHRVWTNRYKKHTKAYALFFL
ncbi:MAG: hypothetical protein CSA33_05180 [Desulfobulbus propionicus]|nr:MAG: hypothetical protein CSA33_05180 [Desulfobulbus propionicus]